MSLLANIKTLARERNLQVIFPEGHDARIWQAARVLRDEQMARPIVLGQTVDMDAAVAEAGVKDDGIARIDVLSEDRLAVYADTYAARRELDVKVARRMVKRPVFFGGMMLACGDADLMVAGVAQSTAMVIQAGALTVGYREGISTPSSFFLMVIPHFDGRTDVPLVFADCAVNISPTPEELADIALASYHNAARLLDEPPRLAMLSFSTKGSAAHADVERVTAALALIREREPEVCVDGELQADAALIPAVAEKKLKQPGDVAGRANVLIFPDLDAANIGYKLTQYLAGAAAIGPFLQGFARPISDVSRGASPEDLVATTAVLTALAE